MEVFADIKNIKQTNKSEQVITLKEFWQLSSKSIQHFLMLHIFSIWYRFKKHSIYIYSRFNPIFKSTLFYTSVIILYNDIDRFCIKE